MTRQIDTVLVANRGEIAVRIIRTLRRMGIRSVAVFSDADKDARHVHEADTAVRLGPAAARESYLAIDKVVDAAHRTGAQGVHPGYGFLSENAEFDAACEAAGLAFLGPPVAAIEVMGDKITAKNAVAAFGVPVVPGIARPGLSDADLLDAAQDIGYPILVKPSAGGGGKGMRLVEEAGALAGALASARREAASSFGDDTLFLERFVLRPRHIEVQILADQYGHVVHLGERECSLQRRHQKVVEEAPSPLLDEATRERIGKAACDTARSVDYTGAGTVEFIVSADRPEDFFFMEMNTRLQVEHPVTEMVTGLDLVEWQVRIARGEPLAIRQDEVTLTGHAIEARVYAEDPGRGFLPTGGTVLSLREPSPTTAVRVDSGLSVGSVVGSDYDPMLAKVIAHGPDRGSALATLDRALADTAALGIVTNIEFLRFLLADSDVVAGRLDTGVLDRRLEDYEAVPAPDDIFTVAGVHLWSSLWTASNSAQPWSVPSGWRIGGRAQPVTYRLSSGTRTVHVHVHVRGTLSDAWVAVDDGEFQPMSFARIEDGDVAMVRAGVRSRFRLADDDATVWVSSPAGTWAVTSVEETSVRGEDSHSGDADMTSPMPGAVIAVGVSSGDTVEAGSTIVVVEAMKMEHAMTTPIDGTVELFVAVGEQVRVDQLLARVTPRTEVEEGKS